VNAAIFFSGTEGKSGDINQSLACVVKLFNPVFIPLAYNSHAPRGTAIFLGFLNLFLVPIGCLGIMVYKDNDNKVLRNFA
jgi:hypothetical protein